MLTGGSFRRGELSQPDRIGRIARRSGLAMDDLTARWQGNEVELNRIHGMTRLDREFHAKREEELLGEQDAIEFELGFLPSEPKGSRRYSAFDDGSRFEAGPQVIHLGFQQISGSLFPPTLCARLRVIGGIRHSR